MLHQHWTGLRHGSSDFEEDPIPIDCADTDQDFDTLAAQVNGICDVDHDPTHKIEEIIDHHFVSGVLKLQVRYVTGRTRSDKE